MHRVIIKSDSFIGASVVDFAAQLKTSLTSSNVIRLSDNYLEKRAVFDGSDAFNGATARPIDLENYAEDCREEYVSIDQYSRFCTDPELFYEVKLSMDEIVTWSKQGYSIKFSLGFVDDLGKINLGLRFLAESDEWQIGHSLSPDEGNRVTIEERCQIGNSILQHIGAALGDSDSRIAIENGVLKFQRTKNSRFFPLDTGGGFRDPNIYWSLMLEVGSDECSLLQRGLQNLLREIRLYGRVHSRMVMDMEVYDRWHQEAQPRRAYYQYLYQGNIRDDVIAFFEGNNANTPVGFVPFGSFWVKDDDDGTATLSFQFEKDGTACFWISGGASVTVEDINRLIEASGLSKLSDQTEVYFE